MTASLLAHSDTYRHDAYQIGDRVTHQGQTWESTAANNVWSPPTFWVVV